MNVRELRGASGGATLLICAALFFLQLGLTFRLVHSANQQQLLTGEEASVSFRDVVLLGERIQHNPMATAFGAYSFYAVGSRVLPQIDLFYGRWWKALFMSLLPPLVFLYGRRQLALSVPGAAAAALVTGLLPPVLAFSWLATDHGLEMLFGFASLLLASTGLGPLTVLGGLLAGLGAQMAVGVAFLPVFLVVVAQAWNVRRTRRDRFWAIGALAAVLFAMALPALWWTNSPTLLTGGGELTWRLWPLVKRNGSLLVGELFSQGGSYYYFSRFPALSNAWLALAVGAGVVVSAVRRQTWWPVHVMLCGVLGIVLVAGGVPGLRRALILCPLAGLFAGALVDEVRVRLSGKTAPRIGDAILAAFVASLLVIPAYQARGLAEQYATRRILFPEDFEYPRLPGKTMAEVTALLLDNPALIERNPQLLGFDRMLCILHVLAERNGKPTANVATVGRIMADWRSKEAFWKRFKPHTIL